MKSWTTWKFNPIRTIKWIIVSISTVQALYVFSPLYSYSVAQHGLTPFAAALASPVLVYVYAVGLLITALVIGWGLYKENPHLRSIGWFGQILLRLFNIIVTIMVAGPLPLTWIYAFTVLCICVVLWTVSRFDVNYARP